MKKILFSPIGGTDPIKYDCDGSMLHICRHYKPDEVYLYISKEMYELHLKDNRYVSCIEQLGKDLNFHFDIKLIIRKDLTEVQEYDYFYDDFNKEIEKIKNTMAEDDILLFNMASGTPAMKSALLIISTIAQYKYIPIQVATPKKSQNSKQDDRQEFDLEIFWECNNDNSPKSLNRCKENKCLNLVSMLKKDLIKQYVRTYNYTAALQIVKEIKGSLSEEACELVRLANERLKLNFSEMDRILGKHKQYDIFPIKTIKEKKLFEYVLCLGIKLKKEEYADFLRAITPLSTDLCDHILKNHCNVDLRNNTANNKKNVRCWDINKMEPKVYRILCENFKDFDTKSSQVQSNNDIVVFSSHLEALILGLSDNTILKESILQLKEVEQKLRNVAAHQIVPTTDDWFKKIIEKNPDDVFSLIKSLVKFSIHQVDHNYWNSYDKMNDLIIKVLN